MPNWYARSEAVPSRGVGYAALLAALPLAAQLCDCAGPSKLDIPPGQPDGGGSPTIDAITRCGAGGIVCGGVSRDPSTAGCCRAGNTCQDGVCAPIQSCTKSEECSSDMTCGGRDCKPWSFLAAADRGADLNCRNSVDLPTLKPVEQCHWPLGDAPPADYPDSVQVLGTPMVMDFDFDKNPATHQPSIVFISYADPTVQDGVLRVIDGNCKTQFSIHGEYGFMQDVSPALGDVDGDKRPDIVLGDLSTKGTGTFAGIAVYSVDSGTSFKLLARQTGSATTEFSRISLSDMDDLPDGLPEIVTDTGIFAVRAGQGGSLGGIVVKKPLADNKLIEPPIVRDINGDHRAEVVTSDGIFDWDEDKQDLVPFLARNQPIWNPYTQPGEETAAFIGMANLGDFETALQKDSVEMVIVNPRQLVVAQVDGTILMNVKGDGLVGGPPVIADFDADGRMEFASPGHDQISVFDLDCYSGAKPTGDPKNCKNPKGPNPKGLLWTLTGMQGASSGASVFDFDGDERAEVVYADQCFMRILDGVTGKVLFSVPRSSITRYDYPVIADVDGDNHTEIVTAENDAQDIACPAKDNANQNEVVNFKATHGVTIWHDANDKWAGSRQVWNQYTYSINNVNDDGTVPSSEQVVSQWNSPELDANSLRQNVQGKTGVSLQLANLTVSASPVVSCARAQARATLSANLCNRGLLEVGAGAVNVRMAPESSPTTPLCEVANTAVLRSGKCEAVTCEVAVPTHSVDFDVRVWADPTNAVAECVEGMTNNTALIANVFCAPSIE